LCCSGLADVAEYAGIGCFLCVGFLRSLLSIHGWLAGWLVVATTQAKLLCAPEAHRIRGLHLAATVAAEDKHLLSKR
jgi:hypothetical protein